MPIDPNIRILIVDDSSTMRAIVMSSLQEYNFENVVEASDGDIALDILRKDKIELILCDWMMERMSGLDLLKRVRMSDGINAIPFIMITSEAQRINVVTAIKEGVNNYLIKPFSSQQLMEKLEKTLAK